MAKSKKTKITESFLPNDSEEKAYFPNKKKIDGELSTKRSKFRRSGHLTDQILKHSYKGENLEIAYDSLNDKTKQALLESNVERTHIIEGIRLSPSEQKIIDSLCKILSERLLKNKDTNKSKYLGNINYELVDYGSEISTPAPKLSFSIYELTQEYKGNKTISGKDVENVSFILQELDKKRFLLSYIETTHQKNGNRLERKIEDFKKLIHIVKISETLYDNKNIELHKKEDLIILLSPIFIRQIDNKYIQYPGDINRRTVIAYGSHNVSEAVFRLRDYLMREMSNKRYESTMSLDKFYWMLNDKWMKEGRKKKTKEYADKAIETMKTLGLLQEMAFEKLDSGEEKITFFLNKNWE